MVKQVYDLLKKLSQEHKLINSFKYEMLSKSAGSGEDIYPLVFLEMPLLFGSLKPFDGAVPVQFNFDIVLNPQALHNYDVTQLTSVSCQEIASQIAQQFIARMRNLYKAGESTVSIVDYSIRTLQRWYDDSSYGVRVSVNANLQNEINFCLDDDYFDPEKEFKINDVLPEIDTDNASGCVELSYKLPDIKF